MPELHILDSLKVQDVFTELNPNKDGATWDYKNNSNIQLQFPIKYEDSFSTVGEFLWNQFGKSSHRIDYIYYHPAETSIKATKSQVVLNTPIDGIYPSDYFGISAIF